MTADGFLQQKQRHPVAMTAAVAINAAAIAALLLAKTDYVKELPTVIWARHIPLPTPPEPEPLPKQPQAKAPVQTPHIPPKQVPTDLPLEPPVIDGSTIFPPVGADFTKGVDPGPPVEQKVTPAPMLTDPAPLASAMRDFQPPYPPQLLRTGVEGSAVVRVLVGTDGRVRQIAIISADDPLFADATERQALRKWRFKPATRDGDPIEAWKQLTVRFQITS